MSMSVLYPTLCFFQREISNAANTAARLYREATPKALRSKTDIWDTMSRAQDRLIKTIRSRNFEKFISVAHKDNGDDFFNEVPLFSICFLEAYLSNLHCAFLFFVFPICISFLYKLGRA